MKRNGHLDVMMVEKQKLFIDFGSGPNVSSLIHYKELDYYTISVNKSEREIYVNQKERRDIEYFKLVTDEMFFFDFSDLNNKCNNHKADDWHCGAVLEHVEPEKIDGFLQNMLNHSKKDFKGNLNIDLTDHEGGFLHYEDFKNPRWSYIKNTLKRDEWYEKIRKYFYISSYKEAFKFRDEQNRPTTLFFTVSRK